jgi:glycosyltransferase involved in cell wall biosynthesis
MTISNQQSPRLEMILARLDGCQGLVESELDLYRQPSCGIVLDRADQFRLSIVIPVYNEEATIARVISRLAALPLRTELIVVDDCSQDGTRAVLSKLADIADLKIILKPLNQGKGAALRTGLEQISGDYVVIQDADLEYDPRDIPQLLVPLLNDQADVVYGSRFIGDEVQDDSLVHRMGNAMLTGASNLLSGLRLTDMETCYKAFTREVIDSIRIEQDRFGIEPEITAKLARRGFRFVEVPISYQSRGYNEGKKIGVKDLINAIYCIGRYGMSD